MVCPSSGHRLLSRLLMSNIGERNQIIALCNVVCIHGQGEIPTQVFGQHAHPEPTHTHCNAKDAGDPNAPNQRVGGRPSCQSPRQEHMGVKDIVYYPYRRCGRRRVGALNLRFMLSPAAGNAAELAAGHGRCRSCVYAETCVAHRKQMHSTPHTPIARCYACPGMRETTDTKGCCRFCRMFHLVAYAVIYTTRRIGNNMALMMRPSLCGSKCVAE